VLRSEGEDYFLLTEQPRIASGRFRFREIPAGMLDGNGHFAGVAAKEIAEETGILLTEEHLIDLTALFYPEDRRVYFSVGGSDEFIRVFLYQQEVTREELEVLRGRLTGAKGENEHITLRVERLRDAIGLVQDMKFLSALTLYREARARGLIEEL
jgi:8-oxo-dGTP pyrophosphatase MutT (NUDIX family)